jgi:hypothetical protein
MALASCWASRELPAGLSLVLGIEGVAGDIACRSGRPIKGAVVGCQCI